MKRLARESRCGGTRAPEQGLRCLAAVLLLATTLSARDWKPHEIRQMNGKGGEIRLPAQFQIVTESWNRVVAVPYLIYMPEKDRLLMLVNCDYPHHAEMLFSDDHGASWRVLS
jgi:hypothetical protein